MTGSTRERNHQTRPVINAGVLTSRHCQLLVKFGAVIPKILVLNDDVDATNTSEVVWAFATRCHPLSGEIHFNAESTSPLVAFLQSSEKQSGRTTKVVYNCLPPEDWGDRLPVRCSFTHNYSKALQEKVIANWRSYGFAD